MVTPATHSSYNKFTVQPSFSRSTFYCLNTVVGVPVASSFVTRATFLYYCKMIAEVAN